MINKVITSIAKATVLLTLFTILSKVIGLVREMIYARNFGLTSQFELFLVSAVIPIVVNTSVVYLGQHYFIPAYNRAKYNSEEEAHKFFSTTFWSFVFGGILLALILFMLSGIIVNIFLSSQSLQFQEIGTEIFSLFLFTIPINAGMYIVIAYLQANFHFIYPAITQIIMNIILIAVIIVFTDIFQIFVLPLAFLFSYLVAFIIILVPVRKIINFNFSSVFRYKQKLTDIKVVTTLIFIEGLSLSYVLVDRYFLNEIPPGSIAALNYAIIIFSLPVSIFSISLITTFFSKFSRSFLNNRETLKSDFYRAISINAFIIIPITFVLIFWGDFFIQLFYQRGKFSAADTVLTHNLLQYYSVGLVFYSSYLVIVKLLYSANRYKPVLIISTLAFLLKIIFNFSFVSFLQQNGLALSTSVVYIILFFTGAYLAVKVLNMKSKYFHIFNVLYFAISATVAYVTSLLLSNLFDGYGYFTIVISMIVFISIYITNSKLLCDEEFGIIMNSINSFFQKQKR
ncbi:MAG: MATE family efflux transporter [Ignavibacteria bacterium]|nr:MATE family efflux transporter [Ignavibacteria bacterium]